MQGLDADGDGKGRGLLRRYNRAGRGHEEQTREQKYPKGTAGKFQGLGIRRKMNKGWQGMK